MSGLFHTYHWSLLSLPKIQTDLLWYLTIASCGLGVLYFLFVFFLRNKLSKKAAMVSEKKKELAPMVSQFLFYEQNAPLDEKKDYLHSKVAIRELIKTKFNRLVLAEILLDLQKDVSGDARQNLYDLYKGLGLHHDAFEKLKSRRWEVISKGILELTHMRVEESYMFIRRFINHRRGVIRKQAQIATVTLKNEGIGYFLDTCKHQISEWQQLKLLDVLRNFDDFAPPRFKIWLTSKNKDVVLFALRLIRYYNQNDANQAIIQLIKHRNNQIKSEAVHCLKEFGVTEARGTIKAAFRRCNAGVKISMLDALAEFGDREDIEFLKKIERSDTSFTVRSKALAAINVLAPELIMPSDDIREPSAADVAFAHVSDSENIEPIEREVQKHVHPMEDESALVGEDELETLLKEEDEIEATQDAEHESGSDLGVDAAQGDPHQIDSEQEISTTDMGDEKELEHIEETPEFKEPSVDIPELEAENEEIFDLCFKEEFQDILEETNEDEDAAFLPLNFLPLVREVSEDTCPEKEVSEDNDTKTKPVDEEVKFKEDLDTIINKLAMKDKPNTPKIREEAPDFLPFVVENGAEDGSTVNLGNILELDVSAEVLPIGAQIEEQEPQAATNVAVKSVLDIRNTEVVGEEIAWQKLLDDNDIDLHLALDEEIENVEAGHEEFQAFSIFREMFRDFDSESKLILLDEILVVGEQKEYHLLESLSDDPDKRVRKKAKKIRNELASKLGISLQITNGSTRSIKDIAKDNQQIMTVQHEDEVVHEKSMGKLPLEYCFFDGHIDDLVTGDAKQSDTESKEEIDLAQSAEDQDDSEQNQQES